MTDVQRHAELCYQESILMKAMLCILYSGDWFAFVKEALNLRNANLAYRNMNEFIRQADAAAGGHDKSIDRHFRSGVLFGDGINSLILSMLPGSIMTVSRTCSPAPAEYLNILFSEPQSPPHDTLFTL